MSLTDQVYRRTIRAGLHGWDAWNWGRRYGWVLKGIRKHPRTTLRLVRARLKAWWRS